MAAQRQIAQFESRIDLIETQYLDALEEQEKLDLQEGIEQDNILNHQKQTLRITDSLESSSFHRRSIAYLRVRVRSIFGYDEA